MDLSGGLVGAFDRRLDGGTGDAEKLGNFNSHVRSCLVNGTQVIFLHLGEFELLST